MSCAVPTPTSTIPPTTSFTPVRTTTPPKTVTPSPTRTSSPILTPTPFPVYTLISPISDEETSEAKPLIALISYTLRRPVKAYITISSIYSDALRTVELSGFYYEPLLFMRNVWEPTGKYILFHVGESWTRELWVMDLDNQNKYKISPNDLSLAAHPYYGMWVTHWHPGGRKFFTYCRRIYEQSSHICIGDLSNRTMTVTGYDYQGTLPKYSPDGNSLAWLEPVSRTENTKFSLQVLKLGQQFPVSLTVINAGGPKTTIQWLSNSQILFPDKASLFVVDVHQGTRTLLAQFDALELSLFHNWTWGLNEVTLSPNKSWLLVVLEQNYSNEKILAVNLQKEIAIALPHAYDTVGWTPDNQLIFFIRPYEGFYTLDPQTSVTTKVEWEKWLRDVPPESHLTYYAIQP